MCRTCLPDLLRQLLLNQLPDRNPSPFRACNRPYPAEPGFFPVLLCPFTILGHLLQLLAATPLPYDSLPYTPFPGLFQIVPFALLPLPDDPALFRKPRRPQSLRPQSTSVLPSLHLHLLVATHRHRRAHPVLPGVGLPAVHNRGRERWHHFGVNLVHNLRQLLHVQSADL